jgi:HK97 family phage portal protein
MGFLDLFFHTNDKAKQPETIKKALQAPIAYPIVGNGGVNWLNDNSQTYINSYGGNPIVYSILKLITDKLSSVPFNLYEVKNGQKLKSYKALSTNGNFISTKALVTKEQSLKEVESHPILTLLDQPNPEQSFSDFLKNAIGYKLLTGNSFIYGLKPEFGINKDKIVGLTVLPSQLMNIIGNQSVEYYNLSGSNTRIEKESILHLKYWNPNWNSGLQLYGQSPLKAALKVLDLNNTSYQSLNEITANKGAYGMMYDESGLLDEDQMKQLKDRFQSASANEILMVSAKLGFTQFGLPTEDLQILEQMNLNLRDLCNIYGVPSLLLSDNSQKTYSNFEQAEKSLIYNVIVPELTALKDSLNKWLLPAYAKSDNKQYYIDFDITVLPQLAKDMTEVISQLKEMWWVTGNEKRLATNYGEDTSNPLMNEYIIPQNLVPLSEQSIQINTDNQDLTDYN